MRVTIYLTNKNTYKGDNVKRIIKNDDSCIVVYDEKMDLFANDEVRWLEICE